MILPWICLALILKTSYASPTYSSHVYVKSGPDVAPIQIFSSPLLYSEDKLARFSDQVEVLPSFNPQGLPPCNSPCVVKLLSDYPELARLVSPELSRLTYPELAQLSQPVQLPLAYLRLASLPPVSGTSYEYGYMIKDDGNESHKKEETELISHDKTEAIKHEESADLKTMPHQEASTAKAENDSPIPEVSTPNDFIGVVRCINFGGASIEENSKA